VNLAPPADLVSPPGDAGDDVSAGRVPLHIRGHEVLRLGHHRHVSRVDKLQHTIHAETHMIMSLSECDNGFMVRILLFHYSLCKQRL